MHCYCLYSMNFSNASNHVRFTRSKAHKYLIQIRLFSHQKDDYFRKRILILNDQSVRNYWEERREVYNRI